MMASVIFIVAVIELYSYWLCVSENYMGEVKGSDYLIYYYPLSTSAVSFIFSLYFVLKTLKFKVCIYTVVITWIYFCIQLFNLIALIFTIGWEAYNVFIYPFLLCSIMGITLLKLIRCSLKR